MAETPKARAPPSLSLSLIGGLLILLSGAFLGLLSLLTSLLLFSFPEGRGLGLLFLAYGVFALLCGPLVIFGVLRWRRGRPRGRLLVGVFSLLGLLAGGGLLVGSLLGLAGAAAGSGPLGPRRKWLAVAIVVLPLLAVGLLVAWAPLTPANRQILGNLGGSLLSHGGLDLSGDPCHLPGWAGDRRVLAHYYSWYENRSVSGNDTWFRPDGRPRFSDTPALGYYDSAGEEVLREHIRMAKGAGLDGFIWSWWGPGDRTDRLLRRALPIAEAENFSLSVYYETWTTYHGDDPGGGRRVVPDPRGKLISDVEYLLSNYGGSPAFLRAGGQPVLFFYSTPLHNLSFWRDALGDLRGRGHRFVAVGDAPPTLGYAGLFDAVHQYAPSGFKALGGDPALQIPFSFEQMYALYRGLAHAQGRPFFATVVPGYDDRNARPNSFVHPRENGAYYSRFWDAATLHGDWVLVTSFNEWYEGTEAEPSREYGEYYLEATRGYADGFQKRPPECGRR